VYEGTYEIQNASATNIILKDITEILVTSNVRFFIFVDYTLTFNPRMRE